MFGKKTLREEYATLIQEIIAGDRRVPQHDCPAGLRGRYSEANVDPVDQHFFDQAGLIGPTLDWNTNDAWSFEETSDTMRRAWYLDGPDYGRRWTIFYNNLKMGWIEASAAPESRHDDVDAFVASPRAQIDIELHDVRWLPADHILGLLHQAALLMEGVNDGYDAANERARRAAETAMTLYNWEVNRAGDTYVPSMEFSAQGPFAIYRESIAHWEKSGFDVRSKAMAGRRP